MIWYILLYSVLIILFIVCSIIAINNLLLFCFLFVDYSIRSLSKPNEYPPAATWRYIANFWRELFYVFGKYYLYPLKWLNFTIKSKQNQTAVLLVHGYCRTQTDWWWMRRKLKPSNCPIYCVNLEPLLGSIEEIAANKVAEKIKLIKSQTNCQNIILIGHSMGGIVSSYYSAFLDKEKLVKAVVTIGSPLFGTKVSVFAKGENAKQMCPGSNFLAELHVPLHNEPQKFYQVCSRFDNIVFPWQSALLDHTPNSQQLVLPFTGHLSMIYSKEVAEQLNTWIKQLS